MTTQMACAEECSNDLVNKATRQRPLALHQQQQQQQPFK
jgi:hypothetical protein